MMVVDACSFASVLFDAGDVSFCVSSFFDVCMFLDEGGQIRISSKVWHIDTVCGQQPRNCHECCKFGSMAETETRCMMWSGVHMLARSAQEYIRGFLTV